ARSSFGFPLPPLKFRTAGFPQYGFKWTVSSDLRRRPGLKRRPHPPHDSVLYAAAVVAPRNTRSPKGLPVREPLGSMWHDPQQLQHVHPEALGSPVGYVVPTGHRSLRPHPSLRTVSVVNPTRSISAVTRELA